MHAYSCFSLVFFPPHSYYYLFMWPSLLMLSIYISSLKWGLLFLFNFLQAIKILNMIKLYGKPIRVNKVWLIPFFQESLLVLDILMFSKLILYTYVQTGIHWYTYVHRHIHAHTIYVWLILWIIHLIFFLFQASQDKKSLDVGANLFIGNLDPVKVFSINNLNILVSMC